MNLSGLLVLVFYFLLLRSVLTGYSYPCLSFSVAAPHPALKPKAIEALAEIPLAKKPNVSEQSLQRSPLDANGS